MISTPQGTTIEATTDSLIEDCCRTISRKSFAHVGAEVATSLLRQRYALDVSDWSEFEESFTRLPPDDYMADGGRYRRRRHATFSASACGADLRVEAHQPHYQSLTYNELNGGVARHFDPIESNVLRGDTLTAVVTLGCELVGRLAPYSGWYIEVHQFRIETDGTSIALPTPEGTHRDGVTFAMMLMVKRANVAGGVTTIYDLDNNPLQQFTLSDPMDLAIVNDERVRHGVSAITAIEDGELAYRDLLVVTYRHKPASD